MATYPAETLASIERTNESMALNAPPPSPDKLTPIATREVALRAATVEALRANDQDARLSDAGKQERRGGIVARYAATLAELDAEIDAVATSAATQAERAARAARVTLTAVEQTERATELQLVMLRGQAAQDPEEIMAEARRVAEMGSAVQRSVWAETLPLVLRARPGMPWQLAAVRADQLAAELGESCVTDGQRKARAIAEAVDEIARTIRRHRFERGGAVQEHAALGALPGHNFMRHTDVRW